MLPQVRAIITGPADTPYEGGLFVFDVYFPAGYPQARCLALPGVDCLPVVIVNVEWASLAAAQGDDATRTPRTSKLTLTRTRTHSFTPAGAPADGDRDDRRGPRPLQPKPLRRRASGRHRGPGDFASGPGFGRGLLWGRVPAALPLAAASLRSRKRPHPLKKHRMPRQRCADGKVVCSLRTAPRLTQTPHPHKPNPTRRRQGVPVAAGHLPRRQRGGKVEPQRQQPVPDPAERAGADPDRGGGGWIFK